MKKIEIKDCANYTYFRERLKDLNLLFEAIPIKTKNFCDLAVPVGGSRKGGYCYGDQKAVGELKKYPSKFPNARLVDDKWVVWGIHDPKPCKSMEEQVTAGRFYGYHEKAINEFTTRIYGKEITYAS